MQAICNPKCQLPAHVIPKIYVDSQTTNSQNVNLEIAFLKGLYE